MLSLKESFRYQNFLDTTINTLSYYIRDINNAIKVKETHLKSKSNPEIQDEEIEVVTERKFNCNVVDIAFLIKQLIDEKEKLSKEIDKGKKSYSLNLSIGEDTFTLDSAVESAKKTRELANNLKSLVDLKSSEAKKTAKDYKFNINGDQVPYQYNVNVVTTIDFDRNVANDLYKKLLNKADTLSTLIETNMLKEVVEYETLYELHDSVNEIVDKYIENKANK
jgi:hypothetical protein